jgi:hypothetical protein
MLEPSYGPGTPTANAKFSPQGPMLLIKSNPSHKNSDVFFSLLSVQQAKSLNLLNYYGKPLSLPVKITWECLERHEPLRNHLDYVQCAAGISEQATILKYNKGSRMSLRQAEQGPEQ